MRFDLGGQMNEVVGLRRSATALWKSATGETTPVYSVSDLEALVSEWFDYGSTATVFSRPSEPRAALVTSLGDDGWVLRVRDMSMCHRGWSYSKTVTRAGEVSKWYVPSALSELRGSLLRDVDIQYAPREFAGAAWAWLVAAPMPDGFQFGKRSYVPSVVDSIEGAFDEISLVAGPVWSEEAIAAVVSECHGLGIDRVVVRGPRTIVVRVAGSEQRVHFSLRVEKDDVRVSGLIDALGREYTMVVPSREILRINNRRSG